MSIAKGTRYHIAAHLYRSYAGMMEHSFTINPVIQDYHVYKDRWNMQKSLL